MHCSSAWCVKQELCSSLCPLTNCKRTKISLKKIILPPPIAEDQSSIRVRVRKSVNFLGKATNFQIKRTNRINCNILDALASEMLHL